MAESEKKAPKEKPPKAKRPKATDDAGASRTMAARVERSLKDVDRLLAKNPNTPAADRAMAQLEQAERSGASIDRQYIHCLLYTSPSPRDGLLSRMPSSA